MVISRRAVSSSPARFAISRSSTTMRSGTSLHRYRATWLCGKEREQLLTRDATTERRSARRICPVRMENLLCDIQTDRANFFHGRLPLKR
jgi:hypothetical protein